MRVLTTLTLVSTTLAYTNWTTFKANGINLGGWLEQESTIDTSFWNTYSGGASDEWGLCQHLGSQCGPVLEHRYSTYITKGDIDKLAKAGVGILRIPTTYAAWINLPGSGLYSGNQKEFLKEIAEYAFSTYGMHVIVDVHSLPAFDQSLEIIDKVLSFAQNWAYPEVFTIEPINEPVDNRNMSTFGTPAALSDHAASWVLKYIKAVLDKVHTANPNIPVMFQGSFKHPQYWSSHFPSGTNLVFDVHNYHFEGRPTTSANLPKYIRADAKQKSGDGKFPVFVGGRSTLLVVIPLRRGRLGNMLRVVLIGRLSIVGIRRLRGVKGDCWNCMYYVERGEVDAEKVLLVDLI